MTHPPTDTSPAAPVEAALPDVYVLSVDYRDGATTIVRVSHDLDDLFNHYGPDSFSPTQPWQPVASTLDPTSPVSLWETRFATGNDGAHLWIRRMPLHGRPASDDAEHDAQTAAGTYDPSLSLVARGVMVDPTGPDADSDSSAFEAAQDRIVGEVWKWLNRHDAPWSPSDATVSDLAYAIANSDPAFEAAAEQTDSEQTDSVQTDSVQTDSVQTDSVQTDSVQTDSVQTDSVQTDPTDPTERAAATGDDGTEVQPGCLQCQGVNSEQCPRCEFEAEYDADVSALSTLIRDGLTANQTPEKIASTILASEWLDEANDRLVTPMFEGATTRLRNQVLALIPTDNPELIDAGYTVLASDVLDRLGGHGRPAARLDPSLATMSDVEAFRDGFFVNVPTISDADLIALMNNHGHLLALAREWGWNETQVRDDFAAALRDRGHALD